MSGHPSIMATHLGPHCIEIVLIKPLICGHPSIMDESLVPMVAIIEGFHCNTERYCPLHEGWLDACMHAWWSHHLTRSPQRDHAQTWRTRPLIITAQTILTDLGIMVFEQPMGHEIHYFHIVAAIDCSFKLLTARHHTYYITSIRLPINYWHIWLF